jgi:hypothetical protein
MKGRKCKVSVDETDDDLWSKRAKNKHKPLFLGPRLIKCKIINKLKNGYAIVQRENWPIRSRSVCRPNRSGIPRPRIGHLTAVYVAQHNGRPIAQDPTVTPFIPALTPHTSYDHPLRRFNKQHASSELVSSNRKHNNSPP